MFKKNQTSLLLTEGGVLLFRSIEKDNDVTEVN